jgi:hypothetical protein
MPHSLRAKLSGLRYKGLLEDKDYKRLCNALDNEKVLEQIRAEIEQLYTVDTVYEDVVAVDKADVLQIIDNYTK